MSRTLSGPVDIYILNSCTGHPMVCSNVDSENQLLHEDHIALKLMNYFIFFSTIYLAMICWCWNVDRCRTVVRINRLLLVAQQSHHHKDAFYFCIIGKAREKLKWADGKAVKAEIDMQVRYWKYVIIKVMYLKWN